MWGNMLTSEITHARIWHFKAVKKCQEIRQAKHAYEYNEKLNCMWMSHDKSHSNADFALTNYTSLLPSYSATEHFNGSVRTNDTNIVCQLDIPESRVSLYYNESTH